ncbi:MAG: tRNA-(ms[2]io[6]A)-hydroxylase [Myxococcota bacterium]
MLRLKRSTRAGWVQAVQADLPTLVLDHAHCEKKAASTALNLIFRYQDHPHLMVPLSEVAREELEHFELVLGLLSEREWPFVPLEPSPYAGLLYRNVRKAEPHRLLDTLLACALIEARSCERMKRLATELEDAELRALYGSLLESEARHHALYVDLALHDFDRQTVMTRLDELANAEVEALSATPFQFRVHSLAEPERMRSPDANDMGERRAP